MDSVFKVKIATFEGPLDLLLSLIEKRKLHINDVSLSKVADDFINHIRKFENFPMNETSNFILIASTLLLIKSKSLLPNMVLSAEEEENIEDLEIRLRLYRKFKELSKAILNLSESGRIYLRESDFQRPVVFSPDRDINVRNLTSICKELINNFPKDSVLPKAEVRKILSLEEMIQKMTEKISSNLKMNFSEFTKNHIRDIGVKSKKSRDIKINIIVSFLALLELIKRELIVASQDKPSEEIEIETYTIDVPKIR
ncbi:MAG TPA: segregation/condensation protein A [Candidatus Paceibacterota bacterium]